MIFLLRIFNPGYGSHAIIETSRIEIKQLEDGRIELFPDTMDVRRLDIPMAYALLMEVKHDLNELLAERATVGFIQAAVVLDDFRQTWPGQELQDQIL